jgi:hypothetical protein
MRRWIFSLLVFALGVSIWVISPYHQTKVYAANRSEEAMMSHHDTTIHQGQQIEDVLILGHNVTVSGEVSQILVVLNGNIHLTSTSRSGIVVSLGGTIQQDAGAHVNAIYRASLVTPFWDGTLFGGVFVFFLWASMLGVSLGLILTSALFALILQRRMSGWLAQVEQSLRKTGIIGFLTSLIVLALACLCAVTVVGLPIAGILLFVYIFAGLMGFSVISLWVGKLSLRNRGKDRADWLYCLIGATVLIAFFNIPIIGLLLFFVSWLVGVGAMVGGSIQGWQLKKQS